MIIKSLQQMEEIVSKNKNLIWDGWTVVSLNATNSGMLSKDGILINNKWYLQKRFELTENGWEIPSKIVG